MVPRQKHGPEAQLWALYSQRKQDQEEADKLYSNIFALSGFSKVFSLVLYVLLFIYCCLFFVFWGGAGQVLYHLRWIRNPFIFFFVTLLSVSTITEYIFGLKFDLWNLTFMASVQVLEKTASCWKKTLNVVLLLKKHLCTFSFGIVSG